MLKIKKIKINEVMSKEHQRKPEGAPPICQRWNNLASERMTAEIFKDTMNI